MLQAESERRIDRPRASVASGPGVIDLAEETGRHDRALIESVAVFAIVAMLYGLTVAGNLSAAHDSIYYLNYVEKDPGFIHPHHLAYIGFLDLWLRFWKGLGVGADNATILEYANVMFGAAIAATVYLMLRRRAGLGRPAALTVTALPTFSFGLWFYSVNIEVYVIPLFFLVAAFYVLTAERITVRHALAVGLLNGLAILFHQAYLLFAPAVFARFLLGRARRGGSFTGLFAAYAFAGIVSVGIPYAIATFGVLGHESMEEAWLWLTTFAHGPGWWNSLSLATLAKACLGFGRSVIGGHFLFALPPMRAAIDTVLADHWLTDEAFLVRNLPATLAYLLAGLSVALAVTVAVMALARLRVLPTLVRERTVLAVPLIVWLVSFTLFFFFWDTANLEFWIPQSLCLWILLGLLWLHPAPNGARRRECVLRVIATVLFAVNMAGSIWWMISPENDYYYVRTRPLAAGARAGDLIVLGRSWMLEDYLMRYSPARTVGLVPRNWPDDTPAPRLARIRASIDSTLGAGGSVLVSPEAVELERQSRQFFVPDTLAVDRLWSGYRGRWKKVGAHDAFYYRIDGVNEDAPRPAR